LPLDPIVSLSVALAEAPGTCAFFLGSGVSRDAGVPTGGEVMWAGLRRLHQLETDSETPASDEELAAWQAETGREDMTYSDLLESIAPDQAVRREYLAGFFEGREPGPTHGALADLAKQGLVKVFITTNFDRLLERALQTRGIEPTVVSSDADLAAGVPREHASCLVLKPHGDYLQQTIRNTPAELAALDPAIATELGEILARYGLVVVGYSGADEAIANALRARRSRYGLWWLSRGDPAPAAVALIEATGGRLIRRDTATDFLADLARRLKIFADHPTGETPETVHDATVALLREGDEIGLEQELRRERHWFATELARVVEEAHALGVPNETTIPPVYETLRPVIERRLASLLPLGLHHAEQFGAEIRDLARMLASRPLRGRYVFWNELGEWSCAWLGYVCGALFLRLDRIESLGPLFSTTWTHPNEYEEPIVWLPAGDVGRGFGQLMVEGNWLSPPWEHLVRSLEPLDWLRDAYPELYEEGEPRRSMGNFDLAYCIYMGNAGNRVIPFFALAQVEGLARRVHRDAGLRARLGPVLGLSPDAFLENAAGAIRDAPGWGGMTSSSPGAVANLLQYGTARPE
jgi:hypothetical protein